MNTNTIITNRVGQASSPDTRTSPRTHTSFLQDSFCKLVNSFTNQERINPVKRIITNGRAIVYVAVILALSVVATSSFAQTYKPDWATKLVLAGGGTDVTNTVTLTTAAN